MGANITNTIYNSIIMLSFFNFFYIYTFKFIYLAQKLRFVFPLIFILSKEQYIKYLIYPEKNKEIINCITSSFHATILVISSVMLLKNYIEDKYYDYVLDYSLVYNLYDIVFILKHGSRIKPQILFHHSLIITCILVKNICIIPDNYSYYVALNYLTEITTVPLNMSWQLYIQKKTNTLLFIFYNIITVLLYIPFRLMLNIFLVYDQHYNLETNLKYCQYLMLFLNFFWFYKLCGMVYKSCSKTYINFTNKNK